MKIVLLLGVSVCYCVLAAPTTSPKLVPRRIDTTLDVREFDSTFSEPSSLQVRMFDDNQNIDTGIMEPRLYPREPVKYAGGFQGQQNRYQNQIPRQRNQNWNRGNQNQIPRRRNQNWNKGNQPAQGQGRRSEEKAMQNSMNFNELPFAGDTSTSEEPPKFDPNRDGLRSRAERRADRKASQRPSKSMSGGPSESAQRQRPAIRNNSNESLRRSQSMSSESAQIPATQPALDASAPKRRYSWPTLSNLSNLSNVGAQPAPDTSPPPAPKRRFSLPKLPKLSDVGKHLSGTVSWLSRNSDVINTATNVIQTGVQTGQSLFPGRRSADSDY